MPRSHRVAPESAADLRGGAVGQDGIDDEEVGARRTREIGPRDHPRSQLHLVPAGAESGTELDAPRGIAIDHEDASHDDDYLRDDFTDACSDGNKCATPSRLDRSRDRHVSATRGEVEIPRVARRLGQA